MKCYDIICINVEVVFDIIIDLYYVEDIFDIIIISIDEFITLRDILHYLMMI